MFIPAKHVEHMQGHSCPLLLRRWLRALDQVPGRSCSVLPEKAAGSKQRPGS